MNKLIFGISAILLVTLVLFSGCVTNDTNTLIKDANVPKTDTNKPIINSNKDNNKSIIVNPILDNNTSATTTPNQDVNITEPIVNIIYNLTEIAKHNKKTDCWTAINGKVYDITKYIALGKHPPVINDACGIDATKMFNSKHGAKQLKILANYYLSELN